MTAAGLILRPPGPRDAGNLAAMVEELKAHEGDPVGGFTAETALRDVIAPDAPVDGLIAEIAGAPAGYALWHFAYEPAYAARGAYLIDLYVRPDQRGAGVAPALVAAVAQAVREGGGEFLWWTAYHENARARAFYEKFADVEEGRLVAYALTGESFDAIADDAE